MPKRASVKPAKQKPKTVKARCLSCKADFEGDPDSLMIAHFIASPKCKTPRIDIG